MSNRAQVSSAGPLIFGAIVVVGMSIVMFAVDVVVPAVDPTAVAEPVVTPTIAVGIGVALAGYLFWANRRDRDRYGVTTVGVRKRVSREAVRSDEPCATCGDAETVERARAAKAVVVGGAVLVEYGAVENYACARHAHYATPEPAADQSPAAGESEPTLASDGGTPLDDAAGEIDTGVGAFNSVGQMVFFLPLILAALAVVRIVELLGMDMP